MDKRFLFIVSLCLLFGIGKAKGQSQQNITLKFNDSSEKSTALSALRKITFTGTDLILNYTDGTTNTFSDATIQKMVFGITSGVQELSSAETTLAVYPNPSSSFIFFKNVPFGTLNVTIYRLDGSVMLVTQLSSGTDQIDVSSLVKGFYLLKVNSQTLKFTKI